MQALRAVAAGFETNLTVRKKHQTRTVEYFSSGQGRLYLSGRYLVIGFQLPRMHTVWNINLHVKYSHKNNNNSPFYKSRCTVG